MIIDLVTLITHQKSKSKIGCLWRRQGKYFDICWKVLKCRAWWQALPPGLERKLTETWQVIIWAKNNKTNVSLLWLLVKTKIIHFPLKALTFNHCHEILFGLPARSCMFQNEGCTIQFPINWISYPRENLCIRIISN